MRELGEGMRRMYELMNENDLSPPELYSDKHIFRVSLLHKYIYSESIGFGNVAGLYRYLLSGKPF